MNDLLPASPASFALTLDQHVSREVRQRVVQLLKQTARARWATWLSATTSVVGNAVLWSIEPALVIGGVYAALFALGIAPVVWSYRRKASQAAELLDQDRDVAFIGPDGLVFFSDDGFFVEKRGGWKPWGVREPVLRRFDRVDHVDRSLTLSSSSGYAMDIGVPAGWTAVDTERVRAKAAAFTW